MRAIANKGPSPLLAVNNVETELLPVSDGELLLGKNKLAVDRARSRLAEFQAAIVDPLDHGEGRR